MFAAWISLEKTPSDPEQTDFGASSFIKDDKSDKESVCRALAQIQESVQVDPDSCDRL